jgi:hypothetical protein
MRATLRAALIDLWSWLRHRGRAYRAAVRDPTEEERESWRNW